MPLSTLNSNKCEEISRHKIILKEKLASGKIPIKKSSESIRLNQYNEPEVQKIRKQQKHLTNEERLEIIGKYHPGVTVRDLAKQYGCYERVISNILKDAGIPIIQDRAMTKLNITDVIERYERYETPSEIARRYGVSRHTIVKCLKENGVVIRGNGDYSARYRTT